MIRPGVGFPSGDARPLFLLRPDPDDDEPMTHPSPSLPPRLRRLLETAAALARQGRPVNRHTLAAAMGITPAAVSGYVTQAQRAGVPVWWPHRTLRRPYSDRDVTRAAARLAEQGRRPSVEAVAAEIARAFRLPRPPSLVTINAARGRERRRGRWVWPNYRQALSPGQQQALGVFHEQINDYGAVDLARAAERLGKSPGAVWQIVLRLRRRGYALPVDRRAARTEEPTAAEQAAIADRRRAIAAQKERLAGTPPRQPNPLNNPA